MPNIPLYHLLVVLMPGYLLLYAISHILRVVFNAGFTCSELTFPDQAVLFILAYIAGIILLGLRFMPRGVIDRMLRYPSFRQLFLGFDPAIRSDLEANYKHIYRREFNTAETDDLTFDTIHLRQVEKFVQLSGDWSTVEGMRLLKFFLENTATALFSIAIFLTGSLLFKFFVFDPFSWAALIPVWTKLWGPALIFLATTAGIAWYFPHLCRSYLLAVIHHFNADVTRIKSSNPTL